MSLLGYTLTKKELMLIVNFVDGDNLDFLIFGKEKVISKVAIIIISLNMYNSFIILLCQKTLQEKMFICSSIANGLEHMHTRDPVVIHRDIKPLNIMVGL